MVKHLGITAALGAALLAPSTASAIQVGQAFSPGRGCGTLSQSFLQESVSSGNSYTVPVDGRINRFKTRAFDASSTRGSMNLVVYRPTTTAQKFSVVGTGSTPISLPATEALSQTAITPIPVKAGDIIGFHLGGSSGGPFCSLAFAALSAGDTDAFLAVAFASLTAGGIFGPFTPELNRGSYAANLVETTSLIATPTTNPDYFLSARLTNSAGPLSGQTVTFSAGSVTLCTATTHSNGVATCSVQSKPKMGAINDARGYRATFAGVAGDYASSTDTALLASPTKPGSGGMGGVGPKGGP